MSNYIDIPAYGAASWRAPVSTAVALPATGNNPGDAIVAEDTGIIYVWNGSAWVAAGGGGGGGVTSLNSLTGALSITAGTGISVTPSGSTIAIATSANIPIASLGITIDGGGVTPTTGVKGYLVVPYACTINSVTMVADQSGSAVIDIWKAPYASFPPTIANTITASDLPTLSSAQKSQDSTLTGWTTSISANDVLAFNVNSASILTRVTLTLKVTKT